jgi:hypothetical protein
MPSGKTPQLLLALEHELAVLLVAHVELPLVGLDPLARGVVRRVRRARAEVHEERLLGRDHPRVLDELDRLVGEVGREVIPLLRRRRLVNWVVVINEVGIPLVGLAPEEPVGTLEAATHGQLRLVDAMFISSDATGCHFPSI